MKKRTEYRTNDATRGLFNALGAVHIHIDGSQKESLIIRLLKKLAEKQCASKINYVQGFIAGPQRRELPEVYESHTPAIEGKEALDFFSTTMVVTRFKAISTVNYLVSQLKEIVGTIIEVEQVVGMMNDEGYKELPPNEFYVNIDSSDVAMFPQPSLFYEIHHGFDLPRTEELPISLPKLLEFCVANDIAIGGWFVFDKGDKWAYRSNSFSDDPNVGEQVQREYGILQKFLEDSKLSFTLRTMLERILGIWKM